MLNSSLEVYMIRAKKPSFSLFRNLNFQSVNARNKLSPNKTEYYILDVILILELKKIAACFITEKHVRKDFSLSDFCVK